MESMRKIACAAALVLACASVSVSAEDLRADKTAPDMKAPETKKPKEKKGKPEDKKSEEKKEKKPEKKKPATWTPWDIAFGAATMSDYRFRGITQSNHALSVAAYVEPRYNFNDSLQGYVGLSGESVSLPNHPAGELDFYGGIRPTFGRLALDFGGWYYWYPGGDCFHDFAPSCLPSLPNGNVIKRDVSFGEIFGKAIYAVNDQLSFGGGAYWSPSVFDSGADGTFVAGTAKYALPVLPNGIGWFISADVGHWFLGTSDNFYAVPGFPGGIPFKSYTTWDAGLAFVWKPFTLDLRYYDTNLNRGDCNAFTHDHTASGVASTPINPGGPGSNWCGAAFVAKLSFDLTQDDNLRDIKASDTSTSGTNPSGMKMPDRKMSETNKPQKKKEKPEGKEEKSEEKKPKAPGDFAFGASLMTEFNIRGISGSNHQPAVSAYFEPRYNLLDNLQAYGRVEVDSIELGNRADASINLYAGIRPTLGKLTVDYGWWQRVFAGQDCVRAQANSGFCLVPPNLDYGEVFAKPTYTVDKWFSFGGGVFWSPSVLNSGDEATYVLGSAKYILPTIHIGSRSIGWFLTANIGHWYRDRTPYPSYTNGNIGLTFSSKQYKLDLRFSDTDKIDCDIGRTPGSVLSTAMSSSGPRSDRCKATFIAKFSVDLDNSNWKWPGLFP
jgi:uncharacterized protein (TIGR02001 family)